MKNVIVACCFFVCTVTSYGQTQLNVEKESWIAQPAIHAIDKKYNNEPAVILSDKRTVEYIDDAKNELQSFKTLHKLIHINDDKGIEAFNKVYLPVTNNTDIVDIKARTILPGGKIIEIDKKNIKDLTEDDRQYKIFAMEGLEKGCEVEYYYTYIKSSDFFGREIFQARVPVLDAQLNIISPDRLLFEAKTINTNTKPADTVIDNKRRVTVNLSNLTGSEEEKYANYTANLVRVEYKLSFNTARNKTERLFTWNELAKRIYSNYSAVSEKELKRQAILLMHADGINWPARKKKLLPLKIS
jgi:hypothetical protein